MPGLAGQIAVVTGASRGIGAAIARRFAAEGAAVALLARGADDLEVVRAAIEAAGGRALAITADVTETASVNAAAERVRAELGATYVLVNNAGAALRRPLAQTTDAQWQSVVGTNLDGSFRCCRAFAADLIATRGRIINISSIAGRQGTPLFTAYCAAKHGVVGLTRALAQELRDQGVSVNAICPGSVDTDMLRAAMPGAEPKMSPDDIAGTALFLAAEAPDALTGSCIDVFG